MTITYTPYNILGLIHPLKQAMKQYNYFFVLYTNSTPLTTFTDIQEVSNKLVFYLEDFDKVEIAKDVSNDVSPVVNFVYRVGDDTYKFQFIDDNTLFNNTSSLTDENYSLFISKIIKWNLIPHKNLIGLNNGFTYNAVSLGYTNKLITNRLELPSNGIILLGEVLSESVTKYFNVNDNSVLNIVLNLNKIE